MLRALCFIVAVLAVGRAAMAKPVLDLRDMSRIVDVEEPAISPRGDVVAFISIAQDLSRNRYLPSLALVGTRTHSYRVLLRGHDVAVPRFSPDGGQLAYLARPSAGAFRQLFVRSLSGTVHQVTQARGEVIDAAWSPDGRSLAYVAADPQKPAVYFFAGDNDYTATALTPSDHLWIVSARGGHSRRLTSGDWTIAPTDPGGIFSPQIAWTRNGRRIAFTRVENTFSGDSERSTLWQADTHDGSIGKLTGHAELELSPAYSPDGQRLTYWYPRNGDFNSENTLRTLQGGTDRSLGEALDRNIAGSLWFPDGRQLLICASDATQNVAWILDLNGAAHALPLGALHMVCDPYSSSTFDAGIAAAISRDGSIAFVATSAHSARELYYLAAGSTVPRKLTNFNKFLSGVDVAPMNEITWNGPNGFQEDGVVTYPPSFPSARHSYPVVLLIHGGPGLSSKRDFVVEDWPLAQMLAARGYIVFQPNYRGSDNLGNAYMTAIVRDTVRGPSADILAGLAALEQQPKVDATRVAVTGWSYGGELTSWLIGQVHTWRAAVSGAAVNSEFDEYNLSTSNVQDRYPMGSSPYVGDGQRVYRDNSPITYYRQITTPTLIWATTLDPVVPIPQAYALFHALTDNHVPVRFAVFPASTHGPADPQQTLALTRLWIGWLDAHMR